MPVTCPRCDAVARPNASSCADCAAALTSASTTLTLTFPAEHPEYDHLDVGATAPAPTLMPGPEDPPDAPAPTETGPPRRKAVIAVAVLVVAVAVAAVALLGGTDDDSEPSHAVPRDSPEPAATSEVDEPPPIPSPTPEPVPTDEDSALRMLQGQVAGDRARVDAITERWVPQLSSKKLGLVANGTSFTYLAIWSDFAALTARYPGAMLLWSGDYSGFRFPDFWVTVAPVSFDSGELANGWCDSVGLDRDNCYAKRITHTGTYADSTLLR